jgi:hypothetical protein
MVIVMNMNSGKVLDEACNHYNDVYSDEVLYAAWTDAPRVEAGLVEVAAALRPEPVRVDVEAFMARLYAGQE